VQGLGIEVGAVLANFSLAASTLKGPENAWLQLDFLLASSCGHLGTSDTSAGDC
jgi:hypothetical protein